MTVSSAPGNYWTNWCEADECSKAIKKKIEAFLKTATQVTEAVLKKLELEIAKIVPDDSEFKMIDIEILDGYSITVWCEHRWSFSLLAY